MQFHAFADVDGIGFTIGTHLGHICGQHGLHAPLGIKCIKRLIDMLHDQGHEIRCGRHRIEGLRLADHREIGAGLRLGLQGRHQCRQSHKTGGCQQMTPLDQNFHE